MIPLKGISDQEINLNHTASPRIHSEVDFVLDHPGLYNPAKGDQNYLSRRQATIYPRKDQMLYGFLGNRQYSDAWKNSGNPQFAQKTQADSEKSLSDHILPP